MPGRLREPAGLTVDGMYSVRMSLASLGTPLPERSAKTLLLTILGEAVAPGGRKVWQETLVRALTTAGVSGPAARQAISRAVQEGMLTSDRVGRRALMTITDQAWDQLHDGRERTMSFGEPQEWDGRWLVVVMTVPESQRHIRHHLRTELAWLGYGSLGNGVWISPQTTRLTATMKLLNTNEELADAYLFVSDTPVDHTPRSVARAAWDLNKLLDRYTQFLGQFIDADPIGPAETFAYWIELITSWRHFPLLDPELPDSLLPANWPRTRSRELFRTLQETWTPTALDYFHGRIE